MRHRRFVRCVAAITMALLARTTPATSSDSTVTAQASLAATVDFTLATSDQQPACLMAMGGVVSWTGYYVAHAQRLSENLVRVWGDNEVGFIAGDYIATASFTYEGTGSTDADMEVVVGAPVHVDFVSRKTGNVIATTFRFEGGANAGGSRLLPWSLALQKYTDVTCR